MAVFMADTDKIVAVGTELKDISKEFIKIADEMYTKLENISNYGVWTSETETGSAQVFLQAVAKDKENIELFEKSIDSLGEQITLFGKKLKGTADTKM